MEKGKVIIYCILKKFTCIVITHDGFMNYTYVGVGILFSFPPSFDDAPLPCFDL